MNRSYLSYFITATLLASLVLSTVPFGLHSTGEVWADTKDTKLRSYVPLSEQPAVRHRILLVKNRLEIAPAFESTVNAEYRNTLGPGLKIEYHLSDMWSIGALGVYGVSINTGLTDKVLATLPDVSTPGDATPTKAEYEAHLNDMTVHGAAYIGFTPWYGKLAAFGKAFLHFDFYFQGGLAFAQLTNDCPSTICNDTMPAGDPDNGVPPDDNANNDFPLNDGTRLGVYVGGGIHVFLNDWLALDLMVRSYLFNDNPSGLDNNFDRRVDDSDKRFISHLFMGVGLSFFLPFEAKRTR